MRKHGFQRKFCFVLCIIFMLISVAMPVNANIFTFETQYDHDEANTAWLTDLIIKEDMQTVEGLSSRTDLIALPEYPYTETADSFKTAVDNCLATYKLDTDFGSSAYVYFFEIVNASSGMFTGEVNEFDVENYLVGLGVDFPKEPTAEEWILAKALFVGLTTGTIDSNGAFSGISLENLAIQFFAEITGMNINEVNKWLSDADNPTLSDYMLAASKYALWINGYNVGVQSPAEDIFTQIAFMTVKSMGISVDDKLSKDELQLFFTSALLGKKFDVAIDKNKLKEAIEKDNVAYYILQIMGSEAGLSIREDNADYETAFKLVAENTNRFDIEEGEFYADIYRYKINLSKCRDSIWIYPTAYSAGLSYQNIIINVNDIPVRHNYYTEIKIDSEAEFQTLKVEVTASTASNTAKCEYIIDVYQDPQNIFAGDEPVYEQETSLPQYNTSSSIVTQVLSGLGVNSVISAVLNNSYVTLPNLTTGMLTYIAPTFNSEVQQNANDSLNDERSEFYITILDEVGAVMNTSISGISGLSDYAVNIKNIENFITFE